MDSLIFVGSLIKINNVIEFYLNNSNFNGNYAF